MIADEDFTGLLFFDENDEPFENDAMHLEKGRPRKFSSRSEAARYAANIRWANNHKTEGAVVPPHIQAMQQEAAAIRAELDQMNTEISFSGMQRSSPKSRPKTWTDDKGLIQINTADEEMIPSPRLADIHDRVMNLGAQIGAEAVSRTLAERDAGSTESMNALYAKHMKAVVAEMQPVGGDIKLTSFSGGGADKDKPEIEAVFGEVGRSLPTTWTELSGRGPLDVRIDLSNSSPYFSKHPSGVIGQQIGLLPADSTAAHFKSSTMKEVVGHEYTHMVEARKPIVAGLEVAFLAHRTTGYDHTSVPPLRQRITSTAREPRVMALGQTADGKPVGFSISKDSFVSLYSGRHYDTATKMNPYIRWQPNDLRSGAFEVLSTGIEQYLGGNRGSFDTDHMSFVLGVLATT